jgi:hypothetical protein
MCLSIELLLLSKINLFPFTNGVFLYIDVAVSDDDDEISVDDTEP